MAKTYSIIYQCYYNLSTAVAKYQDNWMCDETWVRVISLRYPDVINSISFSREVFNRAISGYAAQCGSPNELGIFMHQFWMLCPYDSGKRRRVSYFYRQVAGKPPAAPSGPHDCNDEHVRPRPLSLSTAEHEMTPPLRIVQQSVMPQSTNHRIKGNPNDGNDNKASGSGGGGGEEEGGGSEEEVGGNLGAIAVVSPHRMIQRGGVTHINKSVYWDSPEAAKLFGFNEGG